MAFNLIESVKNLFGKDLISKASTTLGEDENKVQNAVSGIVPSVLAGILNKAGSGDADEILTMAKDTASSGVLSGIGNFLGNNSLLKKGADLLKGLFGDHMSDVTNMISNSTGIRSSSAASLMSMAAPAALGTIGKQVEVNHMNAGGLLGFLDGQKDKIINAIPAGLNLAGALGLSNLGSIGSKLSGALSGTSGQVKDLTGKVRKTSTRWVVPVIVIAAVLGLLYLFTRKNTRVVEAPAATEIKKAEPVTTSPPPTMATINLKLPNGVEIAAYRGGIEDQLVSFLSDPSKRVDKNTWFDFDKLTFETGSSTITPESMVQVQNIAAILKAFPHVSIKIGGYTDKTGNEDANLRLSQARADAVISALKNNGITSSQLVGAEGYGSQFAKAAANAPDEDRRKDRRIAVSVRAK